MTIREFLSDKLISICLHIFAMAALAVFLLASGVAFGVVVLVLIVWVLGLSVALTAGCLRTRAKIAELNAVMQGLEQKYLFAECVEPPKTHYERVLFDLMRRSGKAMIEAVSVAEAAQSEYREYIETWVHEIKAPLTVAGLIGRGVDADTRRKLERELAAVESHVERALFYARAKSAEKDLMIRQTSLSGIVAEAVDKHRSLLMQNGVRVETEGLDTQVYTDGKWAVFMLGQLLQNAVRYRGAHPVIALSAKTLGQMTQLLVRDNGIGISPHELPRVMDRGFTGSNGRARGGATGMGLYICRQLAEGLGMNIALASAEGEGTTVTLTFPAKKITKM